MVGKPHFTIIVAVMLLSSMTTPVGAASIDLNTSGDGHPAFAIEKGAVKANYEVHQTLDIEKNGTVTVQLRVNRIEAPDQIYLRGTYANTTPTFIEGETHVQKVSDDPRYIWKTSEPVTYRIDLQDSTAIGKFPKGITPQAVWFSQRNILTLQPVENHIIPRSFIVTVDPPQGWNGTAPGKRTDADTYELPPRNNTQYYTPKDIYAVGDFTVHISKPNETAYRVAHVPSADGPSPSEHLELLSRTGEILGNMTEIDTSYGRLGLVVPADAAMTDDGQARHHSYVKAEANRAQLIAPDSGDSVYVHEIAHTYAWFGSPDWLKEGGMTFLEPYALYKAGYISKETYKKTLANFATDYHGEINRVAARQNPYEAGATVLAALNLDIRARTDRQKDVTNFFAKIFDQRQDPGWDKQVSQPEMLSALNSLTGADYSEFITQYVDSPDQPEVVAANNYSLEEGKMDPYVQSNTDSDTPTTTTSTQSTVATTITSTQTTVATTTTTTQTTDTEEKTSPNTPTTIQDTDGDGVIDSEDYAPRDPEVQEKSDLQSTSTTSPGVGMLGTFVALLLGVWVVRRSN